MFFILLSAVSFPVVPGSPDLPAWLAAALAAMAAGTLTRKQIRKLKWKMAVEMVKGRLGIRRKQKKGKKEGMNTGMLILSIVLILLCFGVAIWLGMLKEFLILIGAVVLFFILFMGAAAKAEKKTAS